MPRLPVTALACLALASGGAAVAGCGSSNDSSSTSTPAASTPAPASAPASKSGVVEVSMKDIKFLPHDITVKVGQKIHWTNNDQIAHTVTATSGAKFDSGPVNGGATYDFTPTKAGVIDYVCTIHAGQTGTITVTK